jgi:hypothetical protein
MRFMALLKANADTEAGKMANAALLAAMGEFDDEMMKAGVLEIEEFPNAPEEVRARELQHRERRGGK